METAPVPAEGLGNLLRAQRKDQGQGSGPGASFVVDLSLWCVRRSALSSLSLQSSRDLMCFVQFDNVNVYYGQDVKSKYKAPTDFCFVLKVEKRSSLALFLTLHERYYAHIIVLTNLNRICSLDSKKSLSTHSSTNERLLEDMHSH